MSSRPDIPLVLLVLGSVVLAVSLGSPSGSQSALALVFLGIDIAIFLYAVFWGLIVRRGMAVRLYRNQALGMSLVSLGLLSILITIAIGVFPIFSNAPILVSNSSYGFRFGLYGLLVFFWVDSSMRASQDMDPLSRDSLRWNKLRYVLWGVSFAGMGVFVGFLALTGDYAFFDNPPPGFTSTIIQYLAIMPALVPFVAGIVALPIGVIRSKDRSFRRQLQWFALAVILLFGFIFLAAYVTNNLVIPRAFYGEAFLVTGYCFFRSTRALVPLSRISSDGEAQRGRSSMGNSGSH